MTATPIEADPFAWRALDDEARKAIRAAAKSGRPAPTEREAIAAVAWSRWWRARYPYHMIMLFGAVLVGACAALVERVGPGSRRLGLDVVGIAIAIIALRLMAKRRRVAQTASVNYPAATERSPRDLPATVRLTRPRMWFVTNAVLNGSYVFWVACTIYAIHAPGGLLGGHPVAATVLTMAAAGSAITLTRDGLGTPRTATIGPAGISVPWWRATIAWSAVRLVEVAYDGGEWKITWYVARGSVRTTRTGKRDIARFAAMTKVEIICEEPDLALWLTRRYQRDAPSTARELQRVAYALRQRLAYLGPRAAA